MKIEKKNKLLNFSEDVVIQGSKKDLLEFENILQFNGIKNDKIWNKQYRKYRGCIYIYIDIEALTYSYHNHNCNRKPIDVEDFLTY